MYELRNSRKDAYPSNTRNLANTNPTSSQSPFNPFQIPPNIQECYFHRVATRFGKPLQRNLSQQESLNQKSTQRNCLTPQIMAQINQNLIPKLHQRTCPCCGQQPKQQLPILCQIQQIYNINQSLGYYFTYIKVMGLMLCFIALIVGVYAIYEIVSTCNLQKNCLYIYGIPVSEFHVFFTKLLIVLESIIFVIMYGFIAYLYYINVHIHWKIYLNHKKASDFSVLLTGIDHQKVSEQDILNHFKQFHIVDILYTHKIQDYISKLSQKSIFIAKKHLYYKYDQQTKLKKVQKKIDKIDNKILNVKNKLNLGQQKSLRTDKIIIKFKTSQEKLHFDSLYKENIYQTIFHSFCGGSLIQINGCKIYVEPLGEPHQIVWENLELKSKDRYLRILAANLMTFFLVGCSYLIIGYLAKVQKGYDGAKDILLSIVFSIVIQATNYLLDILIERVTEWQKRYTVTGKMRVILVKNFIYFLLNTTILPFTLFIFAWGVPDQDDLIRNIFTLFFISNFISPFVSLYIRPGSLYNIYKKNKILKEGKDCVQTQIKANQYFEKEDFDLSKRYTLVIQIITNSIFYAAVFPFGVLITIVGLFLAYWTSKWWLIRHCSIPNLSYRLGRRVNDITTMFPCILAFGYALNLTMLPQNGQFDKMWAFIVAGLTLLISIVFLLSGNTFAQKIVQSQYRALGELKTAQQKEQMQRIQHHRVADYRQLNPTTFFHSQIHKDISQTEFQSMLVNMQSYMTQKDTHHLRRDSFVEQEMFRRPESRRESNQFSRQ